MSANLKWTRQHELELINDVANGKSLEMFAQGHNRSVSAVELRLKKIIYENCVSGKSFQTISQLLKINLDKITQYYYSYKEFKEKRGGTVEGVAVVPSTIGTADVENNNTFHSQQIQQIQQTQPSYFQPMQQYQQEQHPVHQTRQQTHQPILQPIQQYQQVQQPIQQSIQQSILQPNQLTPITIIGPQQSQQNRLIQQNQSIQQLGGAKLRQHQSGDIQIDKAFGEPNNLDKIESKLRKLEVENRILKLVVENKDLTQQLDKLISEEKVDSSIKQLIKVVRKSIK